MSKWPPGGQGGGPAMESNAGRGRRARLRRREATQRPRHGGKQAHSVFLFSLTSSFFSLCFSFLHNFYLILICYVYFIVFRRTSPPTTGRRRSSHSPCPALWLRVYIYIHTCICVYIYIYIYVYICIYIYISLYIYIYILYLSLPLSLSIYIYIYTYTYVSLSLSICVYICTYMYT